MDFCSIKYESTGGVRIARTHAWKASAETIDKSIEYLFVATFRVARLTSLTPKLWLVGVVTDRDALLACRNDACLCFFSFYFSCFFFCWHKKNRQMKEKDFSKILKKNQKILK